MASNTVITVLSMTIGFFFVLIGTVKLTPAINEEVYREMRKMFIRQARVFPFAKLLKVGVNPHLYRKIVGINEVVCGSVMAIIPGPLKEVANLVLLIQMMGAVYTHFMSGDGFDKMTPSLVFGMLLICRYIIHLQVRTRDDKTTVEKKEQ